MKKILAAITIAVAMLIGDGGSVLARDGREPKIGDEGRIAAYCYDMKSARNLLKIFKRISANSAPTTEYKKHMMRGDVRCYDVRLVNLPRIPVVLVEKIEEHPLWAGKLVFYRFKNRLTGAVGYTWMYLKEPSTPI